MSEVRTTINPDELQQKLTIISQCLDEVTESTVSLSRILENARDKVNANDAVINKINENFAKTQQAMTAVTEANNALHAAVTKYVAELEENVGSTLRGLEEV